MTEMFQQPIEEVAKKEPIKITLNELKPFSENRGDMQPDDPCYIVAYFQGEDIRVTRKGKPTKIRVLLPFDAQGELVPDDGRTGTWAGKDAEGKVVTHRPLWNDDMRALLTKKQKEAQENAEEGVSETQTDIDWASGRVNWMGWLSGQEKYPWEVIVVAGKKTFGKSYMNKRDIVEDLIVERKIMSADRLSQELKALVPADVDA
jgi:hypothetical protein